MSVVQEEDVIDLELLDHLLEENNYMPLIMLDGFFAGIASLNEDLLPEQWLEHISLNNDSQAGKPADPKIMSLLIDYYESILHDLAHSRFKPLLDEEASELASKIWANGFLAGLSIEDFSWLKDAPEDISKMINILSCYRLPNNEAIEEFKLLFDQVPSDQQINKVFGKMHESFELIANELFFFKTGGDSDHQHHHGCGCPTHKTPKIQRNDPCPCGSGKKFKKCCLH